MSPERAPRETAYATHSYGVLKGRVVEMRFASGRNPHYQIRVADEKHEYRIAVNVQSQDGSQVMFCINSRFEHPNTEALGALPQGWTLLQRTATAGGLDYIRGNLFQRSEMVPLPYSAPGPDNDLNEKLDHFVQRALGDEESLVYAFGERWGPENKRDKIFGFMPGNGVHDIHMSQGNDARFQGDAGTEEVYGGRTRSNWLAAGARSQDQPR